MLHHPLRQHAFAVYTLQSWNTVGETVNSLTPILSISKVINNHWPKFLTIHSGGLFQAGFPTARWHCPLLPGRLVRPSAHLPLQFKAQCTTAVAGAVIPIGLLSGLESCHVKRFDYTYYLVNRANTHAEDFKKANSHISVNNFGSRIVSIQKTLKNRGKQ